MLVPIVNVSTCSGLVKSSASFATRVTGGVSLSDRVSESETVAIPSVEETTPDSPFTVTVNDRVSVSNLLVDWKCCQ